MTASERTRRTLEVAAEIAGLIGEEGARCAIIGAVALAIHGYARATQDLDLATELDPSTQLRQLGRELEGRGYLTELTMPDAEDPLGGVLTVSGDAFDDVQVVNFHNPSAARRTPATRALDDAVALEGVELRVVTIADLVLLKLYAGGIKNVADIVGLMQANPEVDLGSLRPRCSDLGLEAELSRVIAELALA